MAVCEDIKMYCAKCGAVLAEDAKKCDRCGAPVRIRPAAADHNRRADDSVHTGKKTRPAGKAEDHLPENTMNTVMDPVNLKKTGSLDVETILKIVHEEEAEADVASEREAAASPKSPENSGRSRSGKNSKPSRKNTNRKASGRTVSEKQTEPAAHAEPVKRAESVKHAEPERHREAEKNAEPAKRQEIEKRSKKEEPAMIADPDLDMLTYLATLPLLVKLRRKIMASAHAREEAADARRMAGHIARASRYYENLEAPKTKGSSSKSLSGNLTSAVKEKQQQIRAGQEAARAAREKEKQIRAEQEAEKAARRREEQLQAEQEKAARLEAKREQEAAAREREAQLKAEQEKAAAARAKEAQLKAEQEKTVKAERDENPARQNLETAEAVHEAVHEEEEKLPGQETGAGQSAAAAAETSQESRIAEKEAARVKWILEETTRKAALQKRKSEEERRLDEARRLRRLKEDETDSMDHFLGKYGLTKDTAVKLATLFLIAVLSLIYMFGRGGHTSSGSGYSQPSEGMTGAPAATDTAGEAGMQDFEQEVPTGGGDFQNTQQ